MNLNISKRNQVMFATKNIKFYEPKILNARPDNIKTTENLNGFNANLFIFYNLCKFDQH